MQKYEQCKNYQIDFKNAQREAQDNKAGLWSPDACNGDTSSTNIIIPSTQINNDNSCTIKGNISSGGKIYHMIGCGSYAKTVIDETKGEKWFCTEQEAINAGWRKALNCS